MKGSGSQERRKRLTPGRALGLLSGLLVFVGILSYAKGRPFLPVDDYGGVAYPRFPTSSTAETAKDLWKLGTLERPQFYALYDYFLEQSRIHTQWYYRQDVFTETRAGTLLPKHPVIISVMGAPFYGLMGQPGFWLFQQLVLLALVVSFYRVCRGLAGADAALLGSALAVAGTNLVWFYSYEFSYDLLGTLFILAGLSYAPKFPLLAGALFGLSLYVRLPNAVLLPFLVLACHPPGRNIRAFGKPWLLVSAGFLVVVFPYLVMNHWIYGDAIKGNYAWTPVFVQGRVVYDTETTQFAWDFFRREALPRLWGRRESLFFAYPALFLGLLSLPWALRTRERWFVLCLSLAGFCMILLFLFYSGWLGAGGDRYVLPAALLLLVPASLFFRHWMERNSSGKDSSGSTA